MKILNLFFAALGLAMFLEGLPYFISPLGVRRFVHFLDTVSDGALRLMGFVLMCAGLAVAYLATR